MREPAFDRRSPSKRCRSRLRRFLLRDRGADVGIGGLRLGARLPDVLGARAGQQEPELGVGLIALRIETPHGELHVGRVEACDDLAGGYAIAFGHAHLEHTAADIRGHPHFCRLDVAGGARPAVLAPAAPRETGHERA